MTPTFLQNLLPYGEAGTNLGDNSTTQCSTSTFQHPALRDTIAAPTIEVRTTIMIEVNQKVL